MSITATTRFPMRRVIIIACLLSVMAQALVMAAGVNYDHHHDAHEDTGYQLVLDVLQIPHDDTQGCHTGSHCHSHGSVLGLNTITQLVFFSSNTDIITAYTTVLPRYSPASPFRPPIV